MKCFENPEIEIIRFAVADIVTTSNEFDVMPLDNQVDDEMGISAIN